MMRRLLALIAAWTLALAPATAWSASVGLPSLPARGTAVGTDIIPIQPTGGVYLFQIPLSGLQTFFNSSLISGAPATGNCAKWISAIQLGDAGAPCPAATALANTVFAGPTSGGAVAPTFRALVTADYGSATITGASIVTNTVANANLAQMATNTIKANNTGGTANAADLTVAQTAAMLAGTTSTTLAAGNDARFATTPQNSQSAAYTLVLADAGGQIYHPSADVTARIITIPANASVAFLIGTKIDLVNDCSAGAWTISITTDTLVLFPAGTTGSRTIAACGEATLSKVTATRWTIVGAGVS